MSVCLAKQRGVAVVTALLLTTLAVTIVASLFWQQQVQVRSMENQRLHLQTRWILRGALDWAKLILWQDGLDNRDYTAETGVWATPLAETRLDQYVERERLQNESYDATIAGQVYDAQSRYNLANLAANGAPVPAEVEVFQRLLDNLQLDVSLAQAAAQEVARSQPVPGGPVQGKSGSVQMDMLRVEDLLAVAGFTPAAIEQLREFVVVLPERTDVNVNTASAQVLSALVPNMTVSEAQSLVVMRKRTPFVDKATFDRAANKPSPPTASYGVKSGYFLVLSQVKLDRAALETWALIKRVSGTGVGGRPQTSLVWIREI